MSTIDKAVVAVVGIWLYGVLFATAITLQIEAITIVVVLLCALFALSDIRARLRLLEARLELGTNDGFPVGL